METKDFISSGKAVLGIEFGSTRIKAVLVDDGFRVIAQGSHEWENKLENGIWTYSLADVEAGVRDAYAKCAADVEAKYGVKLAYLRALGVSGMMHGYLPFDENDALLTPFRTWRNVITDKAATELSDIFRFNVPQRWSIAHYYQAILNREEHVSKVRKLTTLAGFVHYRLSGENVMGIGEASGMFPIDVATGDYNERMIAAFDAIEGNAAFGSLKSKLPRVLKAGDVAGHLTEAGAKWLDPTGTLQPGAVMAPPEGDAGTGMVATNSVAPKTGNVSAGTSVFAMIVLEEAMKGYYREIDVVTTPVGHEVAMVHCNNCTNEINAWKGVFDKYSYPELFAESLKGEPDCGGITVVPFLSGEPVAGVDNAMLKIVRRPDTKFTLANFMRAQIYSAFVSLKFGMDILAREKVTIDSLMGHGGIFKDKGIAQQYLADALDTPVTCMSTASEGGPWGMAVLAAYTAMTVEKITRGEERVDFEKFLSDEVFADAEKVTLSPTREGVAGFAVYAKNFKEAVEI